MTLPVAAQALPASLRSAMATAVAAELQDIVERLTVERLTEERWAPGRGRLVDVADGDGWTRCSLGHRHWGLHGAAGLLLVAPGEGGVPQVLLQHRAVWSHHGGTWGIPGGARAGRESAVQAALREAAEETGLEPAQVRVLDEVVDDHGGWAYTTVRALADAPLDVRPLDGESLELAWVPVGEVADRLLHPGFAAGWDAHLAVLRAS